MKTEIWLPISGYEGIYEISNFGRVKSLNYLHTGTERIMKPYAVVSKHGNVPYLQVDLHKCGCRKSAKVHILVCEAFHGGRPCNFEAMHINGISLDNRADNLKWGSHKENCNETSHVSKQVASTKKRWAAGEYEYQKKPVIQLTRDGIFVAKYPSAWDAQRATGYSQSDISKHCRGVRKWLVGGYRWKFADA